MELVIKRRSSRKFIPSGIFLTVHIFYPTLLTVIGTNRLDSMWLAIQESVSLTGGSLVAK